MTKDSLTTDELGYLIQRGTARQFFLLRQQDRRIRSLVKSVAALTKQVGEGRLLTESSGSGSRIVPENKATKMAVYKTEIVKSGYYKHNIVTACWRVALVRFLRQHECSEEICQAVFSTLFPNFNHRYLEKALVAHTADDYGKRSKLTQVHLTSVFSHVLISQIVPL